MLTQAFEDYKLKKSDPDYRLYNLGLWTADLKEYKLVLTADPSNTEMHRQFIRGNQTQQRRRPGGKRTDTPILIKKEIDKNSSCFGMTWA